MNSLYKIYIKKTAVMFVIGILFSLLFTYLTYSNCSEAFKGFPAELYDTWEISKMLSDYASCCFMLNLVLTAILIYNFYMYRNKRTGIFIRQLPVRSDSDFIIKAVLIIVFITVLAVFEILIFNILTKDLIADSYGKIAEYYNSQNIQIKSLAELYNEYYSSFKSFYVLTLFVSSAMFLFSGCLGITSFSIALPFIVFLGFMGFLFGFSRFITDLRLNIDTHMVQNLNYIINRLRFFIDIKFETSYPYVFELTITFILYIISYFCSKFINYSKIGQLFLFKWAKVLTYFFGCIFGGFSFYYIGSGILTPDSTVILVLILFISIAISYIIINKIEKVFI